VLPPIFTPRDPIRPPWSATNLIADGKKFDECLGPA
jgi:hypothetical protein